MWKKEIELRKNHLYNKNDEEKKNNRKKGPAPKMKITKENTNIKKGRKEMENVCV